MKIFTYVVLVLTLILFSGTQQTECPVSAVKTVSEITYEVWLACGRPTGGVFAMFYNFPYNFIDIVSEVILNDELPYIGSLSEFVWNCVVKVQQDIFQNISTFWNSKFCYNNRIFELFFSCYWILAAILALFFFEAGCAQSVHLLKSEVSQTREDERHQDVR